MIEHYTGFVAGAEWIWLILIAVVIIVPVAVLLSRRGNKDDDYKEFGLAGDEDSEDEKIIKSSDENALNILKERLAKGEITKEEYDDLKSALE